MNKLLLVSLLLLGLAGCTAAEAATSTLVPPTPTQAPPATATALPATPTMMPRNLTNVEYFDGRRLDLYRPEEGSGPFPTVLVFHGYTGTKGNYTWLGEALSDAGYAAVIPNWSPVWLAAENGLCSLAWVQANAATYDLDPQRIVAFGHSGGGTIAATIGAIDDPGEIIQECPYDLVASDALKGVIAYAGNFFTQAWFLTEGGEYYDFVVEALKIPQDEGQQIRQALLDTPPEQWREIGGFGDAGTRLIYTLPPGWIDGSEPPFLLIHGSEDPIVAPLESEAFAAQLEAAGVEVQVALIPGAKHNVSPILPGYDGIWDATVAFLGEVLD